MPALSQLRMLSTIFYYKPDVSKYNFPSTITDTNSFHQPITLTYCV